MGRVIIKNKVPDIYIKESRDFQLLCDLFDLMNSGVKFDIDTITSLSDTQLCRDSMLRLLQGKLGLNLKNNVTDATLRKILKCFPFILRNKGTRQGIVEMIHLFLNIIYSNGSYKIEIENHNNNKNSSTANLGCYVIVIVTTTESDSLKEMDLLDDLLGYIVPTGYKIQYSLSSNAPMISSEALSSDTVYVTVFKESEHNRLRGVGEDQSIDSYTYKSNRDILHSLGATVVSVTDCVDEDYSGIDADKEFNDIDISKLQDGVGDSSFKEMRLERKQND